MTEEKKQPKKRRRPNGDGSVFQQKPGGPFWIAYTGPDGKRIQESSGSKVEGVASKILRQRIGAREHNLPVVPRVEHVTFDDAAQAVITDFKTNGKRSLVVAERRINKHLLAYFRGKRMAGIGAADVQKYIAHRQEQGIVRKGKRVSDVSNAEINRELQLLKRIFSLAIEHEKLARRPKIRMLKESAPRSGFFEREQYESVIGHLSRELRPLVTFAYVTGWRLKAEILPLEWRQVDFEAGTVRLDPGTTKNGDAREFHLTMELRRVLEEQKAERERLQRAGHLVPYVFFREVAERRGGEKKPRRITSITKAWKKACRLAGCPGRIPHDLRRTAVRNLVRAGVPEGTAMDLTGHRTRSVFERYNITSGGDKRDAARKLDAARVRTSVASA